MRQTKSSAFITGGADGIGAGIATRLAAMGYGVTVADINLSRGTTVAQEINSNGGQALAVMCDVSNESNQRAAFDAHVKRFGGLNVAVLNAGIMENGNFLDPHSSSSSSHSASGWQKTLDVNLLGVIYGIRIAVNCMERGGVIMSVASAGGIFPIPLGPIYSASKSGVVMLTHSLGPSLLRNRGIRLCSLCPEYVDTALVRGVRERDGDAAAAALLRPVGGRLLQVDDVVDVGIELLHDPDEKNTAGKCIVILANKTLMTPKRVPRLDAFKFSNKLKSTPQLVPPSPPPQLLAIPRQARKIVVQRLSPNFRQATEIVTFPLPSSGELPTGCVLIRNLYVGINASDVNFTSGRYQGGGGPSQPPFDAGFEACGVVVAVEPNTIDPLLSIGQSVATMTYGGFSEFSIIPAKQCFPVHQASPAVLALLTSGLTASISLEQVARLRSNETVLVTAAAGGTGQFFVQLAKAAGALVIATCGSAEKGALLRRLGADRVVNYHTEDLKQVLKKEYPRGVDLVCELVGGDMFKTCVNALAPRGRLLVIGAVSQYSQGWQPSTYVGLPEKLLMKSTGLLGFFLPMYATHFKRHLGKLIAALEDGTLQVALDPTPFVGLESVFDAVEYLQSGRSMGKVYATLLKSSATSSNSKL